MSLSVGIVGLPNVGKSTLFKTITKKQVDISNYPFCTIEPNVGVVAVPDERLEKLAIFSNSKKIVPATIQFVDIAGLVRNANKGEGLGNQFLAHIKEVDMICEVVRVFNNGDIIHVEGKIDPKSDIEIINYELILKDLDVVEKHLEKTKKEAKSGDKEKIKRAELLEQMKNELQKSALLYSLSKNEEFESIRAIAQELGLLTIKPILFLFNGEKNSQNLDHIKNLRKELSFIEHFVLMDVKLEAEITELSEEEKKELGYEGSESSLDLLIKSCYNLLNLITFLTTGEDETRAWTIEARCSAPQAAGKIHSDFEKQFIRAEVIYWRNLLDAGSLIKAKEKGLIKTEGKEYLVKDGDVIEFKI